jgi:hypothetical protein
MPTHVAPRETVWELWDWWTFFVLFIAYLVAYSAEAYFLPRSYVYVMVKVMLEILEGRLVACTMIVTVPPPFGMLAGAVNCVTMPATPPGYDGTGPLIV